MNKKLQQVLKNISIKSPFLREGFRMGLVLFLSIGIYTTIFAQTPASNYINYQGVASDASGNVIENQSITVGIALIFGSATAAASYEENHTITTDANGVFSLQIGAGNTTSGTYATLPWGIAVFVTVSIDGNDIGSTELMAVPYAITSGDKQWHNGEIEGDINRGTGRVGIGSYFAEAKLDINGDIKLQNGTSVNEISIDGTLADNSDDVIPTEKAIKAYVDNNSGAKKINDLQDAKSDNDGTDNGSSLFLGVNAGLNDNGTNNRNVGVGFETLKLNTTGNDNTANGAFALYANTTGYDNTANGVSALESNITGSLNTANGAYALQSNTTGHINTATGYTALQSNTTGSNNTATGYATLLLNTTGIQNTANGNAALLLNTTGSHNTANGTSALENNTTGDENTAMGKEALKINDDGNFNTAIGSDALSKSTGSYNTAIGNDALWNLTAGGNNIGIGADARVPNLTGSHQVRIGNTQITYAGIQVAWTITSDAAWKDDIQSLQYGLNMVSQLKPVDYMRKNNETNTREIGFIAQDVELLLNKLGYTNNGMLTTADDGRLSLRYNDFIPVLTKAIQEQQVIIERLVKRVESLENKK